MGTSKSGTGPGAGVPLVPPWVPDPIPPDGDNGDTNEPSPTPQSIPLSPRGRFGPARMGLGNFARTGASDSLRRSLGHYVRKGYGGAATAVRRMGSTARTAGRLYGVLAEPGNQFDPVLLAGRSADEVMDALVEAVRPTDGTQDAETGRRAIRDALSELLERFPDADLLDLLEEQRLLAIESYVALDVYNRFYADVGKTVKDNAPTASTALSRLEEVKGYVREIVSACFRDLSRAGEPLNTQGISRMTRQALRDTFEVFEEYIQ